ncbi:RNB domain-containing ribonuclease [Sphingomonas lutea]
MRVLADPANVLARGLADIRVEYQVPATFPADVLAEAERAAARPPTDHADWTDRAFVTLDPASATDLDQAFAIARAGPDMVLHYAIADVGWFVADGSQLDAEAWHRGTTLYLPDGKAPLYPPVLGEGAASLLPDVPRPAVVFSVRVDRQGEVRLDSVTRAVIRSRAKLAYETVRDDDLPAGFDELTDRLNAAEQRRGAARVDPPEQEVVALPDGGFDLRFRARRTAEDRNAALSLAANLAVADLLVAHQTGLFRVLSEPHEGAVRRLRHTAQAFGIAWPKTMSLVDFERGLDPKVREQAAMMAAIRRAGGGAAYEPFVADRTPWHAAVAATYAHATAPLRRLADRYVIEAALALANGQALPDGAAQAFARLPKVMARAEAQAGQIERAVIDLAEAVVLADRVGDTFSAVVTDADSRGDRIQLCALPVVARLEAGRVTPGDAIDVALQSADPGTRRIFFARR